MALGEVLAEQSVGVLVATSLPWAPWVAEKDVDASVDCEVDMLSHLRALVPGQRAPQAGGQSQDCFGEALADPFGGQAIREREEHRVAATALDQGAHGAG